MEILDNVYVVIKDINGNIISLPIEEGIEKYTIEVYKDEECVKEYFE